MDQKWKTVIEKGLTMPHALGPKAPRYPVVYNKEALPSVPVITGDLFMDGCRDAATDHD